MRRLALAGALICLIASSALALDAGQRAVLFGAPSWVKKRARVDMSFATGQYYGCALACLSLTRASSKTNLLPSSASGFAYTTFGSGVMAITSGLGLLIEEARTNQLLNSAAPATQTTGSLANGVYTLWVNGSGSATMSSGTATGCGTGVATNGTPVNFTTTGAAGTCTVTVSGSLNAFQLEAGDAGSSLIVTAGATATRAADTILIKGTALSVLQGQVGTESITGTWNGGTAALISTLIGPAGTGGFASFAFSTNNASHAGSAANGLATLMSAARAFNVGSSDKYTAAWQVSNYAASLSGATVVISASAAALNNVVGSPFALGSTGSAFYFNGYISRVTLWNTRLPNSQLPGL